MSVSRTEHKYADKINALLAQAESTNHPEEAEAFSKAAERLMIKWGIEEAHLIEAARQKGEIKLVDQVTKVEVNLTGEYHQGWETLATYVMIGLTKTIRPIYTGKDHNFTQVTFVGFTHDLERGRQLFESLKVQCEDAYKVWWKNERRSIPNYTGMERFKMKRQFIISFATAVNRRLVAQRDAEIRTTKGTDLVLANRGQMVDQRFQQMYPSTRVGRNRQLLGNARAQTAGHEAGRRASFARGSVES